MSGIGADPAVTLALHRGRWTGLRRRVFGHRSLQIGLAIFATLALLSVAAPWVWPVDPLAQDLARRLQPPVGLGGTWRHPLGTDDLGRDVLSRLLHGGRISLMIALVATLISGVIGTIMGLIAGYFRGRTDSVVMFLINTRLSMPLILVALAVVSLVGSSLEVVVIVLGLLLWDRFAVVIRAATLQMREREFVLAAEVSGAGPVRIMWSEILPNLIGPLVVVTTLEMAHAVLLEAALSFLGLGVQPPNPSWGLMVAEGKKHLLFNAWMINIPGAAICILVLSINLIGDGIRDVVAPGMRR